MKMEQWKEIDQMFDQALDLDEISRRAFLDHACNGNVGLRREVESLLAASNRVANFIESPLVSRSVSDEGPPTSVGERVGSYRLLREIGRGGMGIVYLAARADDQFQKQVAIKLIQVGPHDAELSKRLRRERQILANLDNPILHACSMEALPNRARRIW